MWFDSRFKSESFPSLVSTQEQDKDNDMMSPLEINDTEGGNSSSENGDQPSRYRLGPVWKCVLLE